MLQFGNNGKKRDSFLEVHVWFFSRTFKTSFWGFLRSFDLSFFSNLKAVTKGNMGDLAGLFWIMMIEDPSLERKKRKIDPQEEHSRDSGLLWRNVSLMAQSQCNYGHSKDDNIY